MNQFVDYDTLKAAFLARFRKEKTPEDVLKKLRELKQKKLGVEDYSQNFKIYITGWQLLKDLL